MDLATIPSYDAKNKDDNSKVISPDDEESELFKDLGF